MNIEFRLPSLTAGSQAQQLRQLYGFLRQTIEQLNWAMGQLSPAQPAQPAVTSATATREAQILTDFNAIKALILKSSDIARASYEKTKELLQLNGDFVASGDFGTYTDALEQSIDARVDGLRQEFERVENIAGSVSDSIRTQKSYLRYGLVGTTLDAAAANNAPGIEIGDFLTLEQGDAVTLQQRFARFTAYGLELFGSDSQKPVAYISDRKLHIEIAQIQQLMMGKFITTVRADGSTVKRWVTEEE